MVRQIRKKILTRLLLWLCSFGISAGTEAAPVPEVFEAPEAFHAFIEFQPKQTYGLKVSISPAMSVVHSGEAVFYTVGADLNAKLNQSAWAAGFELGQAALITAILKLSLLINPVFPIYPIVALLISKGLLAKILIARSYLALHLAQWGHKKAIETIWPESRFMSIDLSSDHSGVVIGELNIPLKSGKPIEFDIYMQSTPDEDVSDCSLLPQFDCLIRTLKAVGIYQWKMKFKYEDHDVEHRFFHEKHPSIALKTYKDALDPEPQNNLYSAARILSTFFTGEGFNSIIQRFLPEPFLKPEIALTPTYGEYSAWIPLGNDGESNCTGLYLAQSLTGENMSSRRLTLTDEHNLYHWFQQADIPGTGDVLNRTSRLHRIPEEVLTVSFEILEELIEELGYQAGSLLTGLLAPADGIKPEPATGQRKYSTEPDDSWEAPDPRPKVDEEAPDYQLMQILIYGNPGQLEAKVGLDKYSKANVLESTFEQALVMDRHKHASVIFNHLTDKFIEHYLVRVAKIPWLVELRKVAPMLKETHLSFIMLESVSRGLTKAVRLLKPYASPDLIKKTLMDGVDLGQYDIVQMLMVECSESVLIEGLSLAYISGFHAISDLIFDALPAQVVREQVPVTIFRDYFIRAAQTGRVQKVGELYEKVPDAIAGELAGLLQTHSNLQNKQYGLQPRHPDAAFQRALDLVSFGDEQTFIRQIKIMGNQSRQKLFKQIGKGKQLHFLPLLFGTFSKENKIKSLIYLAEQQHRLALNKLMIEADPVIRDQTLLEAVKKQAGQSVLKALAETSSLSSIHRARIYAVKTGLEDGAKHLGNFLPDKVALIRGFPAYHFDESAKAASKEILREQRNWQLGRKSLGSQFYVYQKDGVHAQKAYVIAHGSYLNNKPEFVHSGEYEVRFMSKDDHVLRSNHIWLLLEQDFRTSQSFFQGDRLKQYFLTKSYNTGWSFKRMPGPCGKRCSDLLERKSTPLALSAVREHFAQKDVPMDIITIRGKKGVYLETLLNELNRQTEFNYEELIMGNCRGKSQNQGVELEYSLHTERTERYFTGAPGVFMKVYTSLKLHPAFWDQDLWEYFHPIINKPEQWLSVMADYGDAMVVGLRKELESDREAFEKASKKEKSKP